MSIKNGSASQEMTPVHLRANRSAFAMWFGRTLLRVFGWRVEGEIPNHERLLIIGAPHTSNWDFVYAMAAILAFMCVVAPISAFSCTWPACAA